jgi:hypothetical protein
MERTVAAEEAALSHLIFEDENQEIKEALIAYILLFQLQSQQQPVLLSALDAAAEAFLSELSASCAATASLSQEATNALSTINFEVDDAVNKLIALGLAQRANSETALIVVPPEEGALHLAHVWKKNISVLSLLR